MSHGVTEGSGHSETRRVDVLNPDSLRTREATTPVLSLRHLASTVQDALLLLRIVGLMVMREFLRNDIRIRLGIGLAVINRDADNSRVSTIGREDLIAREKAASERCA